jgi:hypothetical protein
MWATVTDPKMVERIWLRPCLQEIYDLEWSPDSVYVIAGSIDSKVPSHLCFALYMFSASHFSRSETSLVSQGEILRAKGRDALALRGHSSYVQGVAWDPMNKMVVTQSADRSCRVHVVSPVDFYVAMSDLSLSLSAAEAPRNQHGQASSQGPLSDPHDGGQWQRGGGGGVRGGSRASRGPPRLTPRPLDRRAPAALPGRKVSQSVRRLNRALLFQVSVHPMCEALTQV